MAHPHRLEFGLSDKGTCIYSLCISHNEHGKVVAAVINWSLYPAEIGIYLRLENVSGDPPSTFLASANTHSLAYRNMRILESIVGPLYKPNKTQGKLTCEQVGQALLLALALATTILRSWVRLKLEQRGMTLPDYLVWCGWLCTVGWVACSVTALNIQRTHPLTGSDLLSDSVKYLKVCTTDITSHEHV
jgi:hypothetical protein